MELLNFDTIDKLDIQKLAIDSDNAWEEITEKDKEGFVKVWSLVDWQNELKKPFLICDYFWIDYNLQRDWEFIWEKVEWIRNQLILELWNLMTNWIYNVKENPLNWDFSIYFKK